MSSCTPPSSQPARLDPSPLGTKEYWDHLYNADIATHAYTRGHIGQVWFDESAAEDRTIAFLESREDLCIDPVTSKVLDLGTGNASMLTRLREEGWEGDLWGVDYSAASVRFARRVVGEWGLECSAASQLEEEEASRQEVAVRAAVGNEFDDEAEPAPGIHVVQHDILSSWPPPTLSETQVPDQFDLVHDKGTFDAISLSAEAVTACPLYRTRVEALVRPGGLLLITSCNWTEEELERWISGDERAALQQVGRISYSRFKFGGQEGGVLSGLCWRRRTEQ